MKFTRTHVDRVYLIDLEPSDDERGFFSRFWCAREFAEQGLDFEIAQINMAGNRLAGTTRGLHYQQPPHAEAKVVSCIRGRVFDVVVDARPDSPTYLEWFGAELGADNRRMLYVPEGFAHGYQALEDDTTLLYLVSAFYAPGAERGMRYDDPAIGIDWPAEVTSISDKDRHWPLIDTGRD